MPLLPEPSPLLHLPQPVPVGRHFHLPLWPLLLLLLMLRGV
jgi:hypothetical protein